MTRANRVLVIALAGIVALAVIAAIISANRPAVRFDAGTPEATVQSYVDAALDRRVDEAARWLDPAGDCGVDDLERLGSYGGGEAVRVVLADSSIDGNRATVRVELVFGSGGPFDSSEYREQHTYRLTRSDGSWLLMGVPWPLYDCWKE